MEHPQDLINRAYQLAWKSGSQGKLSKIELSEVLVREGMPNDLADQAASDTILEVIKTRKKEGRQRMTYGLAVFGLGAALMVASFLVLKVRIVIPVGIMFFGGALAAFGFLRSQNDAL
jgi:hypothetical protein